MPWIVILWCAAILAAFYGRKMWVSACCIFLSCLFVYLKPEFYRSFYELMQFVVLLVTPALLYLGKQRQLENIEHLQTKEANTILQLSEATRHVTAMHSATQRLEEQIAQVTDIYDVTKLTSAAMSLVDLSRSVLAAALSRLPAQSLRWIDLETALTMKCVRSEERGVPDFEQASIADMALIKQAGDTKRFAKQTPFWIQGNPACVWALLYCEDRPMGVLAAEGLAEKYESIFLSIVNQLSLQLARVSLYQRVESLATTDELTGIFVRRHFLELARKEVERSKKHRLNCVLCMVDLDHFKAKNDAHGHLVGDVILREVAQLIKRNLRDIDLLGRYGGEELILMLVETDLEHSLPIAERLRQMAEIHAIQAYDELLSQTISMGITELHARDTLEDLIERADKALLQAKDKGRNCIVSTSVP